jgi:hypothetical protein
MEGRRGWRALAVVGLLGLVAVVAVAAAGHAPSSGASRPSAPAPNLLKDYLATLALLMMPFGLGLLIWAMLLKRISARVPMKKPPAFPLPFIWFVVFMAGIALALRLADRDPSPPVTPGQPAVTAPAGTTAVEPPPDRYEPQLRWLPVIVVGSLLVGFGSVIGLRALRRQRELLEPLAAQATLAEVLALTLDDLRREPDPRKAVIGAYTRMVELLAARGVARRESEAPLEYLERVLSVVSGHSARRLTGLFARARYSTQEVDVSMKEEAIDSLSGLRAEIESGR